MNTNGFNVGGPLSSFGYKPPQKHPYFRQLYCGQSVESPKKQISRPSSAPPGACRKQVPTARLYSQDDTPFDKASKRQIPERNLVTTIQLEQQESIASAPQLTNGSNLGELGENSFIIRDRHKKGLIYFPKSRRITHQKTEHKIPDHSDCPKLNHDPSVAILKKGEIDLPQNIIRKLYKVSKQHSQTSPLSAIDRQEILKWHLSYNNNFHTQGIRETILVQMDAYISSINPNGTQSVVNLTTSKLVKSTHDFLNRIHQKYNLAPSKFSSASEYPNDTFDEPRATSLSVPRYQTLLSIRNAFERATNPTPEFHAAAPSGPPPSRKGVRPAIKREAWPQHQPVQNHTSSHHQVSSIETAYQNLQEGLTLQRSGSAFSDIVSEEGGDLALKQPSSTNSVLSAENPTGNPHRNTYGVDYIPLTFKPNVSYHSLNILGDL